MTVAQQSILDTTKKILGLAPSYTAFDLDVITHINTAFATLEQLGVGPVGGFMIEDDTAVWGDFLADTIKLNPARTYVYMKVRLAFDPPPTSFGIAALERQIEEMGVRLMIACDPPLVVVVASDED